MYPRSFFALIGLLVCLAGGCGGGQNELPYATPERLDKGLVVVLPGVHGRLWISDSVCQGLGDGGVEQAIVVYDWTWMGKLLPFYNLGQADRNVRVAVDIAQYVMDYQDKYPGRPVTLVGYSGGGPLAVWAAEAMPPGRQVDGIILLSPPLVPEYDLRPALRSCRKGAVNFYSTSDVIYLELGTLIFGTMDKENAASAGNLSFLSQETPLQPPYDRLFQIAWQSKMAEDGYNGQHLTIGEAPYVRDYVAPLVRSAIWDQALIDATREGRGADAVRP